VPKIVLAKLNTEDLMVPCLALGVGFLIEPFGEIKGDDRSRFSCGDHNAARSSKASSTEEVEELRRDCLIVCRDWCSSLFWFMGYSIFLRSIFLY
jgi:hypothetical protein